MSVRNTPSRRGGLFSLGRSLLKTGVVAVGAVVGIKAFVSYYERNMVFLPSRVIESTPEAAGIPHEEWTVKSSDGVVLHSWFVPAPESETQPLAVLLLHGNAGNIGDRVHLAAGLRAEGFATLLVDYRGYGQSEGEPTEEGVYRDAETGWEGLRGRGFAPDRIVIYGESLGGAIASWMAERHPDCRALVLDATFTSASDLSRRVLPLPGIEGFVSLGLNSVDRLRRTPVPVLLFHGVHDSIIPFWMSEEIHAAAAGRKEFVRVEKGQHCDAAFILGPEYYRKIRAFVRDSDKAPG